MGLPGLEWVSPLRSDGRQQEVATMEDRELYWYLLGLKSPWTVGGVSWTSRNGGWMFGRSIRRASYGLVRNARRIWESMTTRERGHGGIWTVASARRICTRGSRV